MEADNPLPLSTQFVESFEYSYLVMDAVPVSDTLIVMLVEVALVLLIVGAVGRVMFIVEADKPPPLILTALT